MEVVERFEMIFAIGTMVIILLVYVVAGIIFFAVASKKKRTNPADAKNWKILGVLFMVIGGLVILGTVGTFVLAGIAERVSEAAIFIM